MSLLNFLPCTILTLSVIKMPLFALLMTNIRSPFPTSEDSQPSLHPILGSDSQIPMDELVVSIPEPPRKQIVDPFACYSELICVSHPLGISMLSESDLVPLPMANDGAIPFRGTMNIGRKVGFYMATALPLWILLFATLTGFVDSGTCQKRNPIKTSITEVSFTSNISVNNISSPIG